MVTERKRGARVQRLCVREAFGDEIVSNDIKCEKVVYPSLVELHQRVRSGASSVEVSSLKNVGV